MAKVDLTDVYKIFKAGNTGFETSMSSLKNNLEAFAKSSGKPITLDKTSDLFEKDPALAASFKNAYSDYLAKATAMGAKTGEARSAFIRNVIQDLPKELRDTGAETKVAYSKIVNVLDGKKAHLDGPELDLKKVDTSHTNGRKEPDTGLEKSNTTHTKTEETIERAAKTKASASVEMSSILGDLNPSLLEKKELGTHLKNLESTAHKHNLIDGNLVSNRTAKDIESALDNGESISPSEMKSFKAAKIKEFDDYTKNKAREEISLGEQAAKTKAKAGMTFYQKALSYVALPLAATGIIGGLNAGLAPDNPGTIGRGTVGLLYKYVLGNNKAGDDYAEFLLSRYESLSDKDSVFSFSLFKKLNAYADLKEFNGIEKKDLEAIASLPENERLDKKIEILKKLSSPIKIGDPNISGDRQIALTMFVTKNFLGEPLSTVDEVTTKIAKLEEENKKVSTNTNDKINKTLELEETQMIAGWGEQSARNVLNEAKTQNGYNEKAPSLSESFNTAHLLFQDITRDDTYGVKGKEDAIDQSWKASVRENALDLVEFQNQLKERGINQKAIPVIVDYAKMAIQP